MIETIKIFFTKAGWVANWKTYLIVAAYGAIAYVLGAFGGAVIQTIRDAVK
jgi:hypothetical protein